MYLNKIILVGNLTREIELKALPNGNKVAAFSIATNSVYKDASGAKVEQVEYHNIVVFGKQAETSAQYLVKGQSVLIEGRIQTRTWIDKTSGEKKYRTEIVADRVQFGSKPNGSQGHAAVETGRDDSGFNDFDTQKSTPSQPETKTEVKTGGYEGQVHSPSTAFDYAEPTVNLDDIPF